LCARREDASVNLVTTVMIAVVSVTTVTMVTVVKADVTVVKERHVILSLARVIPTVRQAGLALTATEVTTLV